MTEPAPIAQSDLALALCEWPQSTAGGSVVAAKTAI